MIKLKDEINKNGFEYEREKKALEAIETIFSLVGTKDFAGLRRLTKTKLGSAMLDLAECYGEFTNGSMADWHWSQNRDGEIIRYARKFNPEVPIVPKDFQKENMYYILENYNGSFYTEGIANDEFPSLQAAEKKLQALKELQPEGKYFIVTRLQA